MAIATVGATLVAASNASAQTRTWAGGNGPNWSNAANWSGGVAPTNGSTLVFPASSNTNSTNDLTGLSLNAITISASGYAIGGNPLKVTNAPGIELTTAGTATLSMDIELTTELVQVASGGTLTLSGVITAKLLEKRGPGTLVLTNASAIMDIGSQTNCGVIRALHEQALRTPSGGTVNLSDNCTLRIEANTTLEKQLILRGDGAPGTTGVLEIAHVVVVPLRIDLQNGSPATISVFSGGTLDVLPLATAIQLQSSLTMNVAGTATISRSLVGNRDLIKTNTGSLTLTDTNTFSGDTIIRGGTVFINGTQPSSPVGLDGGTVAGTGTAGTITATAGGISPGVSGPGTLRSSGVTMNGRTTFTVQVNGAQNDRLDVTGAVVLGSAQLSVSGTLPPTPVTIISNDGADPVSGTFTGLPQGATVLVGGAMATISYTGGDGNDVVLNPGTPVTPIVIFPTTLPNGTVGVSYSQTMTATGGAPPYKGSTSGTLPPGLTAATLMAGETGIISGTPTQAGTFTFTLVATDTQSNQGSQIYTVTIDAAPEPIAITPNTLPNGTVGAPYSQTVTATGGVPPYTGSTSGTLPPGLTAVPGMGGQSAIISGTPTQAGTYTFTVTATDTLRSPSAQTTYTVTINAGPAAIVIAPPTLPNGAVGSSYSQTITATGGTGPYTYAVTTGTLPAGVTLNTTSGLVSGTPTTAGLSNFTITATDSASNTGSQAYSVTISAGPQPPPPITLSPTTLPSGTVGVAYSQSITVSGGVGPPYTAVTSGALPPGLSGMLVAGTGATISGTPTQAGSFTFTGTVVDAQKNVGSQSYTIVIQAAPVTIVVGPPSLPNGVVNVAYSQTFTATGGTGPYSFAVTGGTLPVGVTLNAATGVISGTPTAATTANFTITATDAANHTGSRPYALTITAVPTPPITLSPTTLPDGTVGAPYAQTVTASGGAGSPYTLSITSGTLPTGLTFTAGLLSGTPAVAGSYTFTVTAVDTAQNRGSQAYTVTIQTGGTPAPITIGPDLPNLVVGQPVQMPLSASGGDGGPYTFAITGGALPPGLSMTTAGVISGTPTTPGQYNFTVTATDGSGNRGTRSYSISVAATPVPVLPWWMFVGLIYFAIRLAASRVGNRTA